MQLKDLTKARERFNSAEFSAPRQFSSFVKEKFLETSIPNMNNVMFKALSASVVFFETLDRIFRASDSDFDLTKAVETDHEKDYHFENQLVKDLYDVSKAIYQVRLELYAAQAGGATSSDQNQFHAQPSKPRDVDESIQPIFDLIDKAHIFAEEEILPYFSYNLRDELQSIDCLTTSFKIDSQNPGEGIKFILSDTEISTEGL